MKKYHINWGLLEANYVTRRFMNHMTLITALLQTYNKISKISFKYFGPVFKVPVPSALYQEKSPVNSC